MEWRATVELKNVLKWKQEEERLLALLLRHRIGKDTSVGASDGTVLGLTVQA